MADRIARHFSIHGRVQGVWYRDWTVKTARRLGLAGWVRNRPDGTVEAYVEGSAELVERFTGLAHDGPLAAHVTGIEAREVEPTGAKTFAKRADG